MTINRTLTALKNFIETEIELRFQELSGITVYLPQKDDIRPSYPCIFIRDTSVEHHEVLRGVLNPLVVSIQLHSIPNDEDEHGTTEEAHLVLSESLYCLLEDSSNVDKLNAGNGIKVFDIWTHAEPNEREDGRNVTNFNQEIFVAPQN